MLYRFLTTIVADNDNYSVIVLKEKLVDELQKLAEIQRKQSVIDKAVEIKEKAEAAEKKAKKEKTKKSKK